MRYKYIYLFFVVIGMLATGCESDFTEGVGAIEPKNESSSVITITTQRTDGVISLAIDALAHDRFNVWIDLNGDDKRAVDGSEDVKVFNHYLDYAMAAGMKTINLYGDINYLGAASNSLSSIDVSGNTKLSTLNVPLNQLSTIDISANSGLKKLDVSGNKLTTLDVVSNIMLESLWVYNNQLSMLDVSNNTKLVFLDCSYNALSELNLSNNLQLVRLLAYNNKLNSIDISTNTRLNRVWLFGNPLSTTEIENILSSLNSLSESELWITD